MEADIEEQRRVIAEHDRNVMAIRTDFEVWVGNRNLTRQIHDFTITIQTRR